MKLNNIEHIFFDLDHTLWDFDKNSGLAFMSIFKKNKMEVDLQEFLKIYKPINLKYWKRFRENKISQNHLRYYRLKDSFDTMKLGVSDEQIEILAHDYINHLPHNNFLLDGARELLIYLKPRYKLHIITNGFREVQHKKLKNSGIFQYFMTVTTSEDAGAKKPNTLIFEHALKKSGAAIANSLMVGDNLEADIHGANDMGMRTIFCNYNKMECAPNIVQVLKMNEIAAYL